MPPLRLLTTILLVAHLPQSEQWCFGNRSRDVAYCGDGRPRGHRGCRVDDASAEELFTIRITLPSITLAELLGFLIFVELCIISSKVGTANPLLAEIAARSKNQSLLHSDNSSLSAPASPSAERYRDRSRSRADSMPPVDRVLSTNAATFSAALLGDDDVDVEVFMRGCREFATTVLTKLGSFTTPAYKQVHDNMAKVDTTYLLNPERFRSMHAILEEEVHSQMHSRMATSGLADPSAAMGLLWARRGLRYWLVLFRPLLDGTGGLPGYDEAMAAYEETIGPYNGWVMRNMSTVAARVTPDGHGLVPGLAASQEELFEELRAWSSAVSQVLERMKQMHLSLNLEDLSKTL